jgi:hypothetical protein
MGRPRRDYRKETLAKASRWPRAGGAVPRLFRRAVAPERAFFDAAYATGPEARRALVQPPRRQGRRETAAEARRHDHRRALWRHHVLQDGVTLEGINAFTFDIVIGAAILIAMIANIHLARLRPGMSTGVAGQLKSVAMLPTRRAITECCVEKGSPLCPLRGRGRVKWKRFDSPSGPPHPPFSPRPARPAGGEGSKQGGRREKGWPRDQRPILSGGSCA